MEHFDTGDVIAHDMMPDFPMRILAVRDCETDSTRPEPHKAYKVKDPEGREDWLCAYDVKRTVVGGASAT